MTASPWMILPFALLLLAMAGVTVLAPVWWGRHYAKVALGLASVTLIYYAFILRDVTVLAHTAQDYLGFIALIGSLFVVAGGIRISIEVQATPLMNVGFLFAGALAANVLGTTGAAMLLIRPWMQLNRRRVAPYHIAFFIFIIANMGGCLTPIGDPPLFLGYLKGAPFWWVARNCWPMWATGVGMLLAMFYAVDRMHHARAVREPVEPVAAGSFLKLDGLGNLFFLAIILGAVFVTKPSFLREAIMLAAAAGSYFTTPKAVHTANRFHFHLLLETAILFAGIFATMIPALEWLRTNAHTWAANPAPGVFFWGTGGLSSVLDNAPTYLGFLNALGGATGTQNMADLFGQFPVTVAAISVGAVFFGAATYIGNAPNFMVKALAEGEKIAMPGFFGFVLKFAVPFLLPVLVVVWALFFRR